MTPSRLILYSVLLAGRIAADQPGTPAAVPRPAFRVLEQITVPQKDGGSVTFSRVEPPVASPVAPPPIPPVLTQAELARLHELESKTSAVLSISASVNEQGLTVLRWSCHGPPVLQAVSNVDFRLLAGLGRLETDSCVYSLILAVGEDSDPLSPEVALAAQHLPADGRPWFILSDWQRERTADEEAAVAGMAALLDYFSAHKAELVALHARRQADAAARELAARNAPPPPPRRHVIHFWPLQPAQRAAIEAGTQKQGGTQP